MTKYEHLKHLLLVSIQVKLLRKTNHIMKVHDSRCLLLKAWQVSFSFFQPNLFLFLNMADPDSFKLMQALESRKFNRVVNIFKRVNYFWWLSLLLFLTNLRFLRIRQGFTGLNGGFLRFADLILQIYLLFDLFLTKKFLFTLNFCSFFRTNRRKFWLLNF